MSGGFGADKFVDVLLVEVQTGGIFHTELVVSLLNERAFFRGKLAADVDPAFQEKLCDQVYDAGTTDSLRRRISNYMHKDVSIPYLHFIYCPYVRPHSGTHHASLQRWSCCACAAEKEFFISDHQLAVGSDIEENTDLVFLV